jgi:Pyruvate:ferredoxin oxidoreductase and related 2-oxoacid:ferredoxin oxidoreductases, beta subunit
MAPTTLPGMKTETSPFGRDPQMTGYPMQGPEMVAAIVREGGYVARGSIANVRQVKTFIKRALENQLAGNGFSFVEVLSSCPTNWSTNAKDTWNFVEQEMPKFFKVGELKVPVKKEEE